MDAPNTEHHKIHLFCKMELSNSYLECTIDKNVPNRAQEKGAKMHGIACLTPSSGKGGGGSSHFLIFQALLL